MERNIALLIDFENIAAGTEKEGLGKFDIDSIMARIKDKGRILISRSYADWGRFARFKQSLLAANVTMFELTSHGMQDKNRADIAMVVDCLELAYTRDYIDTYVVVSGDSDFTPLVLKLKELNKSVIGIGTRRSTSRLIINACDEFIFYDSIVQKKARKRKPASSSGKVGKERASALELLVEVLDGMQREDPTPPHASVLKSALLRRQPDFSESDLGFGSFTRFLEFARDAGYVLLSRDKKSGGYTVDAVEEADEQNHTESSNDGGSPKAAPAEGTYDDPYFPKGSDKVVARLNTEGLGAVSHPTRMALLEALVEAEADRRKKRRRVNIPFMQEDLAKRLRKTHPELSGGHIRAVLRGLLKSDLLIHKDGNPIRNLTAQFVLDRDAEKLNRGLAELYLRTLAKAGVDLGDTAMLAEFLFGDADHARKVEEVIAWLDAPENADDGDDADDGDGSSDSDAGLDDLDALLVTDDAGEPVEDEAAPETPKKKRTRRPRKKKTEEPQAEEAEEAAPESAAEEAAPTAPAEGDAPAEPAAEDAPAEPEAAAEEAPKKKRTTRRRKKADETETTDEG